MLRCYICLGVIRAYFDCGYVISSNCFFFFSFFFGCSLIQNITM